MNVHPRNCGLEPVEYAAPPRGAGVGLNVDAWFELNVQFEMVGDALFEQVKAPPAEPALPANVQLVIMGEPPRMASAP